MFEKFKESMKVKNEEKIIKFKQDQEDLNKEQFLLTLIRRSSY
jgi:hypothetical protein